MKPRVHGFVLFFIYVIVSSGFNYYCVNMSRFQPTRPLGKEDEVEEEEGLFTG